jgi:hypothetical protein
VLILKINFKIKKYYTNIFLNKKYFEKATNTTFLLIKEWTYYKIKIHRKKRRKKCVLVSIDEISLDLIN